MPALTKRPLQQAMLAASLSFAAAMFAVPAVAVTTADPVVLTFSTIGDSRQDPQGPDLSAMLPAGVPTPAGNCQVPSGTGVTPNPGITGQDCIWLQNSKAWARIMRGIQSQKANLLFFNGDMIMGYGKAGVPVGRTSKGTGEVAIANPTVNDILNSDIMQMYKQYAFWRGMVAPLMETGTYVVPVPGNHETQCKRCGKAAQVENENAWRDNMGDLILDTYRLNSLLSPVGLSLGAASTTYPGVADGLTTSQNQLSYSFDVGTSHFVVINTDPVGNDSHAPNKWLDADLTAAVGAGAKSLFVFGHKPAFFYSYAGAAPSASSSLQLASIAAKDTAADDFWDIITRHQATYFSGHEHIYDLEQFAGKTSGKSSYQVIVGSGGSPFDNFKSATVTPTSSKPNDRKYVWATVSIHKSGKADLNTWAFDETMVNPIEKLDTVTLPAVQ